MPSTFITCDSLNIETLFVMCYTLWWNRTMKQKKIEFNEIPMFWLTLQWKVEKCWVYCVFGHIKALFLCSNIICFVATCDSLHRETQSYICHHTEHHHSNHYYHNLCTSTSIDTNTNTLWNNVNETLLVATVFPCIFHFELFQFKVNGILFSTIQLCVVCCWLTLFYFDNGKCAFCGSSLPWRFLFYLNGSFSFTRTYTTLSGFAHLLLAVHLFGQPAEMLTMFTYWYSCILTVLLLCVHDDNRYAMHWDVKNRVVWALSCRAVSTASTHHNNKIKASAIIESTFYRIMR